MVVFPFPDTSNGDHRTWLLFREQLPFHYFILLIKSKMHWKTFFAKQQGGVFHALEHPMPNPSISQEALKMGGKN